MVAHKFLSCIVHRVNQLPLIEINHSALPRKIQAPLPQSYNVVQEDVGTTGESLNQRRLYPKARPNSLIGRIADVSASNQNSTPKSEEELPGVQLQ